MADHLNNPSGDGRGFLDANSPELSDLARRCDFGDRSGPLHCAFSGGPDSTALIALARTAGFEVVAHHVDHGLRSTSVDEARVAACIAERLGCRFELHHVTFTSSTNLEAHAREARYAVLPADVVTGHTLDDQAETFLIRLMRGSGTSGLAAMRPGPRHPLLGLRRSDTERVCELLEITPVYDPTNDIALVDDAGKGVSGVTIQWRARVRHELLPLLKDIARRDPVPILTRTAALLADDDAVLTQLASTLDPTDCASLRQAPSALARRALRTWLTREGYPPDALAIDRVVDVVNGHHVACEIAGGLRIVRSGGRLRVEEPGQ